MKAQQQKRLIWPLLGIAWCALVWLSYIAANTGYYAEKLSAFGGYILRLSGFSL